MGKKNSYTLLTDPVSIFTREDIQTHLIKERVNLICEAWFESVQSGSINYMSAVRGLTDTIDKCLDDTKITKSYADSLKKHYLPLFLEYIDNKALKNAKPSGFVKMAEDSEQFLRGEGFKTAWEPENSLYREIEIMLGEYGVKKNGKSLSERGIRDWIQS